MDKTDRATRLSLGGVTQDAFSGNSNAKQFIKTIEGMIEEGQSVMREYKRQIELLKMDINIMKSKIETINSNNSSAILPIISTDHANLMNQIEIQKEQNQLLQGQITHIKKEKCEMFYMIEQYEDRCSYLEKKIGFR